ncbi:MAG: hypothetical protein J6Q27_01705 [Clostridia bacterium]|nr:hypothetical protein [Clostridia bacterium]
MKMVEDKKQGMQEEEKVEYEDVKHLSLGSFIGIGLAFGVAAGFSAGNLLFGSFARGMAICVAAGLVGGMIIGIINKRK